MTNYSSTQIADMAYQKWGIDLKRQGKEMHGPCPQCGGTDRFWVNIGNGHYHCRQCGDQFNGWLEDRRAIDPLERKKRDEERAKQEAESFKRREFWLAGFRAGYLWRQWHDEMSENNREWWRSQGITDAQMDFYELGFTDTLAIRVNNQDQTLGAYTIPIRDPQDWNINYIHYRLADAPDGLQKYYYVPGIPAMEFYANPKGQADALVVEGAKKAMVLNHFLDTKVQVVGLPGMNPSREVMGRIKDGFERVWLALDPGPQRDRANWYFRQHVPQAKAISLAGKPDDLVLAGMSRDEFREYARQSK